MTAPFYPIVFLRGWASTDKDIRNAANEPFHGFEQGSTRRRQGADTNGRPFFFESVIVKLMQDHQYESSFRDNTYGFDTDEKVSPRSLWVYRYYDLADVNFGTGQRETMETYAKGLGEFLEKIRGKVSPDSSKDEFKVYLVAHSMGGLVVRCYLQNIARGKNPPVDKVFTYGTPHNGIDGLGGINVPWSGQMTFFQSGVFNREVMRQYLKIDTDGKDANTWTDPKMVQRCFCLVGTDYKDYDNAFSSFVTGQNGDGLVLCRNAFTVGSPRAYVHRAHGGPYGMVNSQEGYENLTRFLFGDWRVDFTLKLTKINLPDAFTSVVNEGATLTGQYLLDSRVAIRNVDVVLHQRSTETQSAATFDIKLNRDSRDGLPEIEEGKDEYKTIASVFLISKNSADTGVGKSGPMLFSLGLALEATTFRKDKNTIRYPGAALPGFKIFSEDFLFQVETDGSVSYSVASSDGNQAPYLPLDTQNASKTGSIGIGPPKDKPLASGQARGTLTVAVSRWS